MRILSIFALAVVLAVALGVASRFVALPAFVYFLPLPAAVVIRQFI